MLRPLIVKNWAPPTTRRMTGSAGTGWPCEGSFVSGGSYCIGEGVRGRGDRKKSGFAEGPDGFMLRSLGGPRALLGRSWVALGAFLWRSWGALGALLGSLDSLARNFPVQESRGFCQLIFLRCLMSRLSKLLDALAHASQLLNHTGAPAHVGRLCLSPRWRLRRMLQAF